MPFRMKPLPLIFLVLIVCSSSLAILEGSIQLGGPKMHESFMRYKKSEETEVNKIMSHRKLMFHSTADYDDAGPNPKHDPRRRPGGKP
ncbi:Transmembrane protein [Hirschfeldia incana]|nr:Transmembrane protein [Hirschfeldia incana]